jgi:hypothetical protein
MEMGGSSPRTTPEQRDGSGTLRRHCERSEAIQHVFQGMRGPKSTIRTFRLDCFGALRLTMTARSLR